MGLFDHLLAERERQEAKFARSRGEAPPKPKASPRPQVPLSGKAKHQFASSLLMIVVGLLIVVGGMTAGKDDGPILLLFGIPLLLFAAIAAARGSAIQIEDEHEADARRERVERVMRQAPYGAPSSPEPPHTARPYEHPRPVVRGSSTLRWVGQQDRSGCVAACVAMMLGVDYRSAANLLLSEGLIEPEDLLAWGMSFKAVLPVLSAGGWVRNDHNPDVWLTDVWGGVDFRTSDPNMRHAVLTLPDGTVLDPDTPEPRRIEGYRQVGDALGFKRLR